MVLEPRRMFVTHQFRDPASAAGRAPKHHHWCKDGTWQDSAVGILDGVEAGRISVSEHMGL